MKSIFHILVLGAACSSSSCLKPNEVCSATPPTFSGAGSTLQGQTILGANSSSPGTSVSNNKSLTALIAQIYSEANECPQFTYNGDPSLEQDSQAGIDQTLAGKVFFGGVDEIRLESNLLAPQGPLLSWPAARVGLVFYYNLPHQMVTPLIFDSATIEDIFSGQFKSWGDLQAAHTEMGLNQRDAQLPIRIVVRSDKAGTTALLNQRLFANGDGWKLQGRGSFPIPVWQSAFKKRGTNFLYVQKKSISEMLSYVASTPGAICYLGLNNVVAANALQQTIPPSTVFDTLNCAMVKDRNGIPIAPTAQTLTDLSYPFTFQAQLITLACLSSEEQVAEMRKFLFFYLMTAQRIGTSLGFGKLSEFEVNSFLEQLTRLTTSEDCVTQPIPCCPA